MKKLLLNLFLFCGLSLIGFTAFGQGVTTSAINGKVTSDGGEELPGATVIAIHQPSGTQYGTVTDLNGFYRISNMRVGGPYKITITFVGYSAYERDNAFLQLGQTLSISPKLQESSTQLDEVVVTAGGIIDGNRTGAQEVVDLARINSTPTLGRSIGDFARFTPQAKIDEGGDGLSISIAGINNRLNAIYIDGAVNNDVFGLAGSGTNGGQTGVSPISLDAIEQFQIAIAPFDVRQSGFAGGSINAITRSGTNEVEGSAYYLFRNEGLAAETPGGLTSGEREQLPEFSAETYGFRVGGPIVKDKAFFFVNAEFQRDETPQPFNLENYNGDILPRDTDGNIVPGGLDQARATINNLVSFLNNNFGYDPGTFENNTAFLESDKIIAKFDFNLTDRHKLTARHSYTRAENLEARSSNPFGLNFINGSEFFISTTNSSAVELRSSYNNFSNLLTVGFTAVRDDRDPSGDPFPSVRIDDGAGSFRFGSEPFSTANLLDQDVFTINNNFELYKGKHTILIGANFEYYRVKNLFIPFNFGDYNFDSQRGVGSTNATWLEDFLQGEPAGLYQFSYALRGNARGDESDAAAEFNASQLGFYVQDEIQVNDKLKVTAGLRADINFFEDTPANPFFNEDDDFINGIYDLQGARTGEFIDSQISWSPRVGFNYDANGDRSLQLRGGVGLFTSRIPLVWPGAAYNNTGLNTGFDFERIDFSTDQVFVGNALAQPRNIAVDDLTSPSGSVDLFADDFKVPQVLKGNLAVDKTLPWGMIGTFEALYTKFINNVYYQNLNVTAGNDRLTGSGDDRVIGFDDVDRTYGRVILGSNTSEGSTYNLSVSLAKPFDNGFQASLALNYGDAFTIYDGTSSQNSSQWRGLHAINGRNFWNETARSDFSQGFRAVLGASYQKDWNENISTQLSFVWEGREGLPFSYIYGDGDDITGEDSRNRELVYVPADANDINLIDWTDGDGNVIATAAEQRSALNAFIEDDNYLSDRRGQYAERNSNRTPFESILDVKLTQDFKLKLANGKKNTLRFTLDIFNFGNLLNKDWGQIYRSTFGGYELLEFEGLVADTDGDETIPTFTYRNLSNEDLFEGNLDDAGLRSSRWQMQIGIRYLFGGSN